jgi:hypothetical protein
VTGTSVCSNENQTVTVAAQPFDDFVFSYWIINHEFCIDNPIVVNVTSNQGLKAVFTQQGVTPKMPDLTAPPTTVKVTTQPTNEPTTNNPTGNNDDDYQAETPKIDNSTWIQISLVAIIIVLISYIAVRSLRKPKEDALNHLDY